MSGLLGWRTAPHRSGQRRWSGYTARWDNAGRVYVSVRRALKLASVSCLVLQLDLLLFLLVVPADDDVINGGGGATAAAACPGM